MPFIVSMPPDNRYFDEISATFSDFSIHGLVWGVSLSISKQNMRDLNVDLFGLGCFFVSFLAKDKRFVGDI